MQQRGAFTVGEFAEWARLGRTKIYELIRSGELPVVKFDTKTLIRYEDGKKLLDSHVGAVGLGVPKKAAAK